MVKPKKLILALAMCFVLSGLATAGISDKDHGEIQTFDKGSFVYILTNYSEPILPEHVIDIQETMVRDFKAKAENKDRKIIYAPPSVVDGDRIVAFCFMLRDDGITSQYIGVVGADDGSTIKGQEQSVSITHRNAESWYIINIQGMQDIAVNDTQSRSMPDAESDAKKAPAIGIWACVLIISMIGLSLKRK